MMTESTTVMRDPDNTEPLRYPVRGMPPMRHNMVRHEADGSVTTISRKEWKALRAYNKAVRRGNHKNKAKG